VAKSFLESKAFVRGIMGPIGSGKSVSCVIDILRRSQLQKKNPQDGIRYSRWAVIRNSYPELKTTTIKTWSDWCPLDYGKITYDSPITHRIKTPELDIEVFFIALDRPDDVTKLLSMELTGAWVNEARGIPKAIIDALTGRVGRYPAKKDGGCTWSGIMMDTNAPDDQHWWYKLAEEEYPDGWAFFKQPSGESPEAENLENLPEGYYKRITAGKDPDWVKVYVHGQYGYVTEGKAVFPMYKDRIHASPTVLEPIPDLALSIGLDFGLTPSAVIGQKLVDGRWFIIDEYVTDNCGVQRFAELISSHIKNKYPDHMVGVVYGDPAGNQRAFSDERTAFEIMREYTGWKCRPAPTNEIVARLEVVIGCLNRMVDGNPGILISPTCKVLRKGFSGGYHYRPIKTGNAQQFHDSPFKNQFSHPHDALQALLLGGGEYNVIMNKIQKNNSSRRSQMARDIDYPIFDDNR
jgi:hypothetical protein